MKLFPLFVAWAAIGIGVAAIASRMPGADRDASTCDPCATGQCDAGLPSEAGVSGCTLFDKDGRAAFKSPASQSSGSTSSPEANSQSVDEILKIREQLGGSAILPILGPDAENEAADPAESEELFRKAVEKMASERSGIR